MPENVVVILGAVFALVTGTAAGVLSLLTWEILQRSPLGRAVFVLMGVLVAFTLYHAVVLLVPHPPTVTELIRSTMHTGVAAFTWTMVWLQLRMRQRAIKGVGTS